MKQKEETCQQLKDICQKQPLNCLQMDRFLQRLCEFWVKNLNKTSLLDLIEIIIKRSYPSYRIIKQITGYLGNSYFHGKVGDELVPIIKLIHNIYKRHCEPSDSITSFFYFNGPRSGINIVKKINEKQLWPFVSGFGFATWFYIENSEDQLIQKIFSIAGNGGLECFLIKGSLYYRIIGQGLAYTEPALGTGVQFISLIKPKTWHFLGLSHEAPKKFGGSQLSVHDFIQTKILINNEPLKQVTLEFPKQNSNTVLNRFVLFENFFGRVSCAILFKESTSKMKQIQQFYSQGVSNFSQLKNLTVTLEKHSERILLILLPERSEGNTTYDVWGDFIGQLHSHTYWQDQSVSKFKLGLIGGLPLIIGLLKFINQAELSEKNKQIIIIEWWRLLNTTLKNQTLVQQEAVQMNIFCTIGCIIAGCTSLIVTSQLVDQFQETKLILVDVKLIDTYFADILWNPTIHAQCVNETVVSSICRIGQQYYTQNMEHFGNILSFKELLDQIIYMNQQTELIQAELLEKVFLMMPQLCDIYEGLQICEQYLLCTCAPKVKVLILQKIKSNILNNKNDQVYVQKLFLVWQEAKIIYSLLFLFQTSVSEDVQAMCINFLNLIFQQKIQGWKNSQQEAINFIEAYFKENFQQSQPVVNKINLRQIAIDTSQKFEQLVINTPKMQQIEQEANINDLKNIGTQFLNSDYDSVPQAPSMINKRQPKTMFFTAKDNAPPRAISIEAQQQPVEDPVPKRQQLSFSVDQSNRLKPKKFNMQIDTDSINSLYSYGGEKGKKKEFDQEAFQEEMKHIVSLARNCVLHMKGDRAPQEDLYDSRMPQTQQRNKTVARPAPMTSKNKVPPIFKAQIQIQECKPYKINRVNPIKEASSVSISSSFSMEQQKKQEKRDNTQPKYNALYASLIGWATNKLPLGNSETDIMIEEGDLIKNPGVLSIICDFYNILQEGDLLRVQVVQDLLCLAKSDVSNTNIIFNPSTHRWLLDILLNGMPDKTNTEGDDSRLLWEIGSRLHTTLLISLFQREQQGWQRIEQLLQWTEGKAKVKSQTLVRHLLTQLYEGLNDLTRKYQPDTKVAVWNNITNSSFYVIQSIVGVGMRQVNNDAKLDKLIYVKDMLPKLPSELDQKYQWMDLNLVLAYVRLVEPIYNEVKIVLDIGDKYDNIFNIFENNNQELLQRIQLILTQDWAKQCFCIYEALLQSGVKEQKQERMLYSVRQIGLLLMTLAISCESILLTSQQRVPFEVATDLFLNIYNYFYKCKDSGNAQFNTIIYDELCNINQSLYALMNYIKTKKQNDQCGFTQTIFQKYIITTQKDLDSLLMRAAQSIYSVEHARDHLNVPFSDLYTIAVDHHFGLNSDSIRQAIISYKTMQRQWVSPLSEGHSPEKIKREILLHGEQKQIDAEDSKRLYLQWESERERTGRNQLKKCWKRLVTFKGPFAPKDFLNYSQDERQIRETTSFKPNPYFTFKLSKYEIKSRAKPFLKISLKQIPDQMKQFITFGNQTNPILSQALISAPQQHLSQIEMGAQQIYKAANQIINMGRFLGNQVKNKIITIIPKPLLSGNNTITPVQLNQEQLRLASEDTFTAKRVQWIRSLTVRNGYLSLGYDSLIFQYEFINEKITHLSLLAHKLQPDRRLIKQWPLEGIKEIVRKKYIQRKSAIEILMMDGRSIFLSFMSVSDMEDVSSKLIRLRKSGQCPKMQYYRTMDPKKMAEKSGLVRNWQTGQISNFSYLMQINHFASRTYNDITQYPVFPWVLMEGNNQQSSPQQDVKRQIELYPGGCFRNMQLTMGAMGSDSRIKSYLERYESSDTSGDIPSFHFGSHYSSPAITSQYLLRIQPFTSAAKEIQGGRFDIADRLFFSIYESFRCATEDVADVRELIPEAFCLPEMFINISGLDFGKTQSGQHVSNVLLPKWTQGNPFKYVVGMKQALESAFISMMLPEWIDLIFGYKQRGKEAEKALNTFFYLTYDDLIDIDRISDPQMRVSVETQIVNFGQTPSQLFLKQHVGRIVRDPKESKIITQLESEIKVYRPSQNKKRASSQEKQRFINIQQACDRAIIKIKWISEERLICVRRDGKVNPLKWWSTGINTQQAVPSQVPFQCGFEKEKQVNLEQCGETFNMFDRGVELLQYPIEILFYGKLFAQGGFWDGRLIMINSESSVIVDTYTSHSSTITAICADKKEQFLVTASKNGHCILWRIGEDYKLQIKQQYFDHMTKINIISISLDLFVFATGCEKGLINMYNLYNGQFMRSIQHRESLPIHMLVLSSTPLCCVIFHSSANKIIYTYNINGFLVESAVESCFNIMCPLVVRDQNFQETLIYGTETGDLVMRSLPFLSTYKRFQISTNSPVLSLTMTKDKKFILCGCNDGEISVLTEPPLKQPLQQ